MAKQLNKFSISYDKIEAGLRDYNGDRLESHSQICRNAKGNAFQGEDHLVECMSVARKNGVTGAKLADFMKDRTFKEAYGLWQKAAKEVGTTLADFDAWAARGVKPKAELEKMLKDIDKDLKSRSGRSESKSEIEALQKKVTARIKEIGKIIAAPAGLPPRHRNYLKEMDKTLARLLKNAPDEQDSQRDGTMIPQMLVDRNLQSAVRKAVAARKGVDDGCAQAEKLAGSGDAKGAQAALKEAAGRLAALNTLNDEYQKAHKFATSRKMLAGTKDEKKVNDAVAAIAKMHDAATKRLKGALAKVKAGASV